MEQEVIVLTPIERLIEFYTKELYTEVVYNRDSSTFWTKAQNYVFENSLASFREGLRALIEGMNESREMYNYFSALCFRMFSQPFTEPALDSFAEGFDAVAKDSIFKQSFQFSAVGFSKVEQLILFLAVHRSEIMVAMAKKIEAEKASSQVKRVRGGNQNG